MNNQNTTSTIFCPNCAWENPHTNQKCSHCGCRLADVKLSVKHEIVQSQQQSPLEAIYCSSCSNAIAKDAYACPNCGAPNKGLNASSHLNLEIKSRVAAGVLALLVGGIGIHKFYCGRVGLGILYLVFFWTFIPALIAFIEGIIYLTCQSDEYFTKKYCY